MESTPVIQIQNLSKQYRLGQKVAFDTLRDRFGAFFRKNPPPLLADQKVVRALRNFDLEVYPGEVLGIIGFNGSGKSTLLKLISRITPPTGGEIKIHGSVSSLLDIGLGFHPDLTGRENIFLNGAILGMKRTEIKAKFDDIVAFSGIDSKFLDTPVKRYSSGMYVRLAFSIAAHLDSDILLIDEVLAVGDYEFQKKCLNKIDSITQSKRTVLFVSHNLAAIEKLCNRTIVINAGEKVFDGDTPEAIEHYYNLHKHQTQPENLLSPTVVRSGNGSVKFSQVRILDEKMQPKPEIATGDDFIIKLDLEVRQPVTNLRIAITLRDKLGQTLTQLYSKDSQYDFGNTENNTSIFCHVKNVPLNPGNYYLDLWAADRTEVLDLVEYAFD
ncbi:MAG: ABC transporter ATP-binding protein, partial [Fidelibacterota bacterium]